MMPSLQTFSNIPRPDGGQNARKNAGSADAANRENLEALPAGEIMTGAQAIVRALEESGVTDVFGIPGGAILPVYDAIKDDTKFRFVLMRHEQAAGHAAEGYALATGKTGVCIVTSGPGATNLVTAIADANSDSVPMVAITGQVGVSAIGTDAFQEADMIGITCSISKHSYLVTDPQDIPRVIKEAFMIANTGRPGPVVVDVSKTAQTSMMHYSYPDSVSLPGYSPDKNKYEGSLREAAKLFSVARRPVLYVGGGAIRANASEQVKALSLLTNSPLTTTLTARGIVPETFENNLGMLGMHGTVAATGAVQECDLLVALGARFDDRVTGSLPDFAPYAKIIHVDIDPAEISKNKYADVPIVGDIATVLDALMPLIKEEYAKSGTPDLSKWRETVDNLQENYPTAYPEEPEDGSLSPQWVVEQLSGNASDETIWVSGVGQHQMWASQLIDFKGPRTWISSSGLGTMGYGLPAAIGAKVASQRFADGNKAVWLIDGDGSFQMTSEELAAATLSGIPLKIAILNNSVYGMVRQWQTMFYKSHYSATILYDEEHPEENFEVPNFVTLAQAYGCVGLRARNKQEALEAIEQANSINDRTVIIDFRVWKDAFVWPMVPAGKSNSSVMYRKGITPLEAQTLAGDDNADENNAGAENK